MNYALAALVAHMDVNKSVIFLKERMEAYRDSLYAVWSKQNQQVLKLPKFWNESIGAHQKWMDGDSYKETRTMPKFTVITEDPSRWQPTPPAYMDGIEPHWNKIRPLRIGFISSIQTQYLRLFFQWKKIPHLQRVEKVLYDTRNTLRKLAMNLKKYKLQNFGITNPTFP